MIATTSMPVGALLRPDEIIRSAGPLAKDALLAQAANVSEKSNSIQSLRRGRYARVNAGLMPFDWNIVRGPIAPATSAAARRLSEIAVAAGILPFIPSSRVDLLRAIDLADDAIRQQSDIDDVSLPLLDRLAPFLSARTVALALQEHVSAYAVLDGDEARTTSPTEDVVLKEKSAALHAFVDGEHEKVLACLDEAMRDGIPENPDPDIARRQAEGLFIVATKIRTSLLVANTATVKAGAADRALQEAPWSLVMDNLRVLRRTLDEVTARRLLQMAYAADNLSLAAEVFGVLATRPFDRIWFDGGRDWKGVDWSLATLERVTSVLNTAWADPMLRPEMKAALTKERVSAAIRNVGRASVRKITAFHDCACDHGFFPAPTSRIERQIL